MDEACPGVEAGAWAGAGVVPERLLDAGDPGIEEPPVPDGGT